MAKMPCGSPLRRTEGERSMSEKNPTHGLALFLAAAIVTFGCLTVMQFLEKPWFFVALAAMHAGIALFVISKRTLRTHGFDLVRYFKSEYAMLLPFLLIMAYSLISKTGALPPFGSAKTSITLVYALICFAVTFWNFRHMHADARTQSACARATTPDDVSVAMLAAE